MKLGEVNMMWFYTGETNRCFAHGVAYEISVEVKQHYCSSSQGDIYFIVHFTTYDNFNVTKKYSSFDKLMSEWLPADTLKSVDDVILNGLKRLQESLKRNNED